MHSYEVGDLVIVKRNDGTEQMAKIDTENQDNTFVVTWVSNGTRRGKNVNLNSMKPSKLMFFFIF